MADDLLPAAQALLAALVAGALVGLERGWRDRDLPEGGRVAGLRTFTLIGLLGAVLRLASPESTLPLAGGLVAIALLFAVSYRSAVHASGTLSITTAVAALATFGLGVLAASGHALLAVAAAVVVAMLLDMKGPLHRGLQLIERAELSAVLQLALFTAVILPLLPREGFGPYDAVNPFRVWIAVIVVAALSLAGHVATRLRGPRQGLLWVGLLGGLASSTAATLTLARAVRAHPAVASPAAAGIVGACAMMFVRMAAIVAVLQPGLTPRLGAFLLLLGVAGFVATAWMWRRAAAAAGEPIPASSRAFDLPAALLFGGAIGVIAVVARAATAWLGDAGMYLVALVSGLADVDAVLVSTMDIHSQGQLADHATAIAVLAAAFSNMAVKATMAWAIGGRRTGVRVAAGYGFMLGCGVLAGVALYAR